MASLIRHSSLAEIDGTISGLPRVVEITCTVVVIVNLAYENVIKYRHCLIVMIGAKKRYFFCWCKLLLLSRVCLFITVA